MIRDCILHIGPHKTGSSAIQRTLFSGLADKAFEYAQLGTANHSMILCSVFSGDPDEYASHRVRGLNPGEVERFNSQGWRTLTRAVRRARAQTVIFSGEGVCRLDREELMRLKDFLDDNFAAVTVAGYVRPPGSLMRSVYQQRIKSRLLKLELGKYYPRYRDKLEKFDQVFGSARTRFWKFAPHEFPGGDVVRHFCAAFAIEPPGTILKINESLSKQAVQVFYAYNKFGRNLDARGRDQDVGPDAPAVKGAIVRALSSLKGEKFRFSADLIKPVLEASRDDIAWAENRIGASLAEPDDDGAGAIGSEEDLLAIDDATIAFLCALVKERTPLPRPEADSARHAAILVGALAGCFRDEHERKRQAGGGSDE